MDTVFWSLSYKNILVAGGVGEGMDTGWQGLSNKNILIRECLLTNSGAGSAFYWKRSDEYVSDRDAILAELGLSPARMSVKKEGVWRPYKIWGDIPKAKAFFGESRRIGTNAKPEIEKQQSEEEKAPDSRDPAERDRQEYEAEVGRELDEEFLRYKDNFLDREEPNI